MKTCKSCIVARHSRRYKCNITRYYERVPFKIAKLVVELTDISKPEDGNRANRKAMDRDKLASASAEAQTIKYADLISNGKDIMQNDPKFAKVYMKEKADLLRVMTKGDSRLRSVRQC